MLFWCKFINDGFRFQIPDFNSCSSRYERNWIFFENIIDVFLLSAQSPYRFGEKHNEWIISPLSNVYECLPSLRSHNQVLPSRPSLRYNEPSGKSGRPNELSHEQLREKRRSIDIRTSGSKCEWPCNALLRTRHDERFSVESSWLFTCQIIDLHALTYYLSPNKMLVIEGSVLWLHETIKSINNRKKETLL